MGKQHAKLIQAKCREQDTPEEGSQTAPNVATGLAQCPQNVVTHTTESNRENKETEKMTRENQTIWNKTIEQKKWKVHRISEFQRVLGRSSASV
jgi:hypothetical protein